MQVNPTQPSNHINSVHPIHLIGFTTPFCPLLTNLSYGGLIQVIHLKVVIDHSYVIKSGCQQCCGFIAELNQCNLTVKSNFLLFITKS